MSLFGFLGAAFSRLGFQTAKPTQAVTNPSTVILLANGTDKLLLASGVDHLILNT